jgi:hypothetical protein
MTVIPNTNAAPASPALPNKKAISDNAVANDAHTIAAGADHGIQTPQSPSLDPLTVAEKDKITVQQASTILQSAETVWAQVVSPASVSLEASVAADKVKTTSNSVLTQSSLAALSQTGQLPHDLLDLLRD